MMSVKEAMDYLRNVIDFSLIMEGEINTYYGRIGDTMIGMSDGILTQEVLDGNRDGYPPFNTCTSYVVIYFESWEDYSIVKEKVIPIYKRNEYTLNCNLIDEEYLDGFAAMLKESLQVPIPNEESEDK